VLAAGCTAVNYSSIDSSTGPLTCSETKRFFSLCVLQYCTQPRPVHSLILRNEAQISSKLLPCQCKFPHALALSGFFESGCVDNAAPMGSHRQHIGNEGYIPPLSGNLHHHLVRHQSCCFHSAPLQSLVTSHICSYLQILRSLIRSLILHPRHRVAS
jgi:hypothetical protein